tara:strand:+ start:15 stop:371 length:357 start_codon:yes stop_codon:yes gene_type:complete
MEEFKELLQSLHTEMKGMREELREVKEENIALRKQLNKKSTLQEEVLSSLNRNKKAIIKQKIMEYIDDRRYSLAQIKELIVDQKHYCSKASFYRYVEQLQQEQGIKPITVNEQVTLVR